MYTYNSNTYKWSRPPTHVLSLTAKAGSDRTLTSVYQGCKRQRVTRKDCGACLAMGSL